THPVQTARHLVAVVVEFAARVQHGHDDLCRGAILGSMEIHRDAPAIVDDRNRVIRVHRDLYSITVPRQGLINGVVYNFEDEVVQPRTIVRVPNIHAWAFAYRLETLED